MTLQGVISTLDNSTVVRLETWLQQHLLQAETGGSAINTNNATAGAMATTTTAPLTPPGGPAAAPASRGQGAARGEGKSEELLPTPAMLESDSRESKMATTIQAQVLPMCACRVVLCGGINVLLTHPSSLVQHMDSACAHLKGARGGWLSLS